MKIAVPTKAGMVDNHFGHCDHYTIFTVNDGKVTMKEILPSPQGCGCKSGIALVLHRIGVQVMLAGNMGEGARNVLQSNEITVIRGCCGNVDDLVKAYLAGEVNDNGEACNHHECGSH